MGCGSSKDSVSEPKALKTSDSSDINVNDKCVVEKKPESCTSFNVNTDENEIDKGVLNNVDEKDANNNTTSNSNNDEADVDNDSLNEFLCQVKDAAPMDEIYKDAQVRGTRVSRNSIAGNISKFMSKKRKSISSTFRK